jgi:isopenicillin-N epimerase
MVAQPLPKQLDGTLLKQRLFEEYSVEIPVNEMNGEQYIRISVQGYNTEADVERFFTAFEKLTGK